jgi:N-glycosidase YbiA
LSANSPIYFYKADAAYGYFSNFSYHAIELAGISWLTVEHYYQAQKFQHTKWSALIDRIRLAPTPEIAAAIGRDPEYHLRPDWENCKWEIMYTGVKQKFLAHPELQQILLATASRSIVEDSPVDYYWGCGADRSGANHLGKILMQIRSELMANAIDRALINDN